MNVMCCWAGSSGCTVLFFYLNVILICISFLVSSRRCYIKWLMSATRLRAVVFIRSSFTLCFSLLMFGSALMIFNAMFVFSRVLLRGRRRWCQMSATRRVPFVSVVFLGIGLGTANGRCVPEFCFCLIAHWYLSVLCSISSGSYCGNTVSGWRCLTFVSFCAVVWSRELPTRRALLSTACRSWCHLWTQHALHSFQYSLWHHFDGLRTVWLSPS